MPRPGIPPGPAPTLVPGHKMPGFLDPDTTPPPAPAVDKRWGVPIILGVFAVPIAIVVLRKRRSEQPTPLENPPLVPSLGPPALPPQPDLLPATAVPPAEPGAGTKEKGNHQICEKPNQVVEGIVHEKSKP